MRSLSDASQQVRTGLPEVASDNLLDATRILTLVLFYTSVIVRVSGERVSHGVPPAFSYPSALKLTPSPLCEADYSLTSTLTSLDTISKLLNILEVLVFWDSSS